VCRGCSEIFALPEVSAVPLAPIALRPDELSWAEEVSLDGGWSASASLPRAPGWYQLGFGLFFTAVSLPFALVIIGLLHFAVGVTVLYGGLCTLLNAVETSIAGGRFRFRQRPLPRGSIDEPIDAVAGFSPCLIPRGRFGIRIGGGTAGQREVRMATTDGRSVRIPFDLPDERHAAFVAARLNAAVTQARAVSVTYRVAPAAALGPVEPSGAYAAEEEERLADARRAR
jgi:hypothetical protein